MTLSQFYTEHHYQSSHKSITFVCISPRFIKFLIQVFSKFCGAAALIHWIRSQKLIKSVTNHFYCSFDNSWHGGWGVEWKQPPLGIAEKKNKHRTPNYWNVASHQFNIIRCLLFGKMWPAISGGFSYCRLKSTDDLWGYYKSQRTRRNKSLV